MRRVFVLIGAVVLLSVPSTSAASSVIESSSPNAATYQFWVDQSKMPTPDMTVQVRDGVCSDGRACAFLESITLPIDSKRATFLHELGHLFSFKALPLADRPRFAEIIGVAGRDWHYEEPGVDSHLTAPVEFFAEAYSLCARYGNKIDWRERWQVGRVIWIGRRISKRQYTQSCILIRRSYLRPEPRPEEERPEKDPDGIVEDHFPDGWPGSPVYQPA